jgi:hypothetical protein
MTAAFFDYALCHRILVLVYPPHSTHTLQPLDVVMFKPLASAYTKALEDHTQRTQGLSPIRMGDFFGLFWEAWVASFRKELILKSFSATGIWPKNQTEILKTFDKKTPEDSAEGEATTSNEWIQIERVLRAATAGVPSDEARKLSTEVHYLAVQNQLINLENQDLRDSLDSQKKNRKKKKVLDLQQRKEYWGGAVLCSPRKIREAQFCD